MLRYNIDKLDYMDAFQSWGANPTGTSSTSYGGLKPPIDIVGIADDVLQSSFVQKLVSQVTKLIPIPFLGDIIGGVLSMLDGCSDNWDKEKVYSEEVEKAKVYIAEHQRILNDTKTYPNILDRLTRAEKFYQFVHYDHGWRKDSVKCGVNKYAETIKFKIADEYHKKQREIAQSIANFDRVTETYNEPFKSPKVHSNVTYFRYTSLKSDAEQKAKELLNSKPVVNTAVPVNPTNGVPVNPPSEDTKPKESEDTNYWLIGLLLLAVYPVFKGGQYLYNKITNKKKKRR